MSNDTKVGNGKLEQISVNKIKEPPCEDRFDYRLTDEEFEHIKKDIPLVVLYSRESKAYVIVEGRRRFQRAKELGFKKFRCFILREVDNDDDALMLRLRYVLDFRQPLHVLEVARLVFQIREREILKHGPRAYYTWGGQRGKKYKKKSFIKVLEEQIPHKSYYLRAVNLLGQSLGEMAIEGLYDYLIAKEENLSIYRVHKMNPILRAIDLRQKIEAKIGEMAAKGHERDDVTEMVGKMVYEVLFSDPNDYDLRRRKRKGGEVEEELESDENKASPIQALSFKPGPIGSKEYPTIKKLGFDLAREVSNLKAYFQGKNQLTATDSKKICEFWSTIQDASTDFWKAFMKSSMN